MFARIALLALMLLPLGCNGPFLLMPGGELSGEVTPVPVDWSFTEDYGFIELETQPADPYSVNIVYTRMDGILYINAGDTETQWVKNMNEDPRVRIRMNGSLYELRVERVDDPEEISRFGKAWTERSMFSRDPADLGGPDDVWIYRLARR